MCGYIWDSCRLLNVYRLNMVGATYIFYECKTLEKCFSLVFTTTLCSALYIHVGGSYIFWMYTSRSRSFSYFVYFKFVFCFGSIVEEVMCVYYSRYSSYNTMCVVLYLLICAQIYQRHDISYTSIIRIFIYFLYVINIQQDFLYIFSSFFVYCYISIMYVRCLYTIYVIWRGVMQINKFRNVVMKWRNISFNIWEHLKRKAIFFCIRKYVPNNVGT